MRRSLRHVIGLTAPFLAVTLLLGLAGCDSLTGSNDNDGGGGGNCSRTSECPGAQRCIAGACQLPPIAAGKRCSATLDCASGLFCSAAGICSSPSVSGRVGDNCLSDDQCTAGLRCQYTGFSGYCEQSGTVDLGDPCTKNLDCVAATFCGQSNECQVLASAYTKFQGVNCTDDPAFKSYFQVPRTGSTLPDFYRLPFPNDIRVTSSGGRKNIDLTDFPRPGITQIGVDLVDLYVKALAEDFDGFGSSEPVSFRFSQDINTTLLDQTSLDTIKIFDVTAGEHASSVGFSYTPNKSLYACKNFLSVYPLLFDIPFRPGHTILILLKRSGLKSMSGEMVAQDADLATLLGGQRPGDDVMGRAWDTYAPVRKYIADNNIAASNVANAALFTVADTTAHMARLAAAVNARPDPPELSSLYLCGSGGTDPCDDGSDARKCGADNANFVEIHGKIKLPIFQMGALPYLKPADGGGLNESGGTVTATGNQDVCFALTMPKSGIPGAGWPLVVYSHGTNGSFRSFITDGIAEKLATASTKAAGLSFDSVEHGARRGGSTRKPEELVFNVLNPRAARDNFLQGAADIMTVLKVVRSPIPPGWTGPTIKLAPKPLFFGHSQGSTSGELALPFTDETQAAVLSGAGASLATSLLNKTSPIKAADALALLVGEQLDGTHPVMTLWGNYFDRSDPMNYGRFIIQTPPQGRTSKHVFMSWGTGDTFSPEGTLEVNAVVLGVPVVAPPIFKSLPMAGPVNRPVTLSMNGSNGKVTGGVFQYNPPSGVDGHFVAWRNPDALKDVLAFITSYFASGVPNVP